MSARPVVFVAVALSACATAPAPAPSAPTAPEWVGKTVLPCPPAPDFDVTSDWLCAVGHSSGIRSFSLSEKDASAKARVQLARAIGQVSLRFSGTTLDVGGKSVVLATTKEDVSWEGSAQQIGTWREGGDVWALIGASPREVARSLLALAPPDADRDAVASALVPAVVAATRESR